MGKPRFKQPAATAPVTPVVAFAQRSDGTRLRSFCYGGVRVQVETIDADHDAVAADLAARLHAVCSIPPALVRPEVWGPGQFDRLPIGPGVEVWLRVTGGGQARMVTPGGDLDITAGAAALGTGIHEVSARAAQVLEGLKGRATGRAEALGHDPVWTRRDCACRRCDRGGTIDADGKRRGALFTQGCA